MSCAKEPLPKMWVKKKLGEERRELFKKSKKFKILSDLIGKNEAENYFYSRSVILNFLKSVSQTNDISGLRIYFANYPDKNSASFAIPPNAEKQLTVIFAPTNSSGEDIDLYYALDSKGTLEPINPNTAKSWVENYLKKDGKWESLSKLISKQDTKCIFYSIELFKDLIREMDDCQAEATGLRLYFCCFKKGEVQRQDVGKQLMVQFVFTKKVGSNDIDYYIDDDVDFPSRSKLIKRKFLDTGNPCPPPDSPPCPGAKLLQ